MILFEVFFFDLMFIIVYERKIYSFNLLFLFSIRLIKGVYLLVYVVLDRVIYCDFFF